MTHYSSAQDTKTLINKAIVFAEKLKGLIDENSDLTPYLVYTGMSGIALATAVSMQYTMKYGEQLRMIYVRKENEVTHGDPLEVNFNKIIETEKEPLLIFVDDFIHSGRTINNMLKALKRKNFNTNCKHETLMLDGDNGYGSFGEAGIRYDSESNKYHHIKVGYQKKNKEFQNGKDG